MKIAEVFLNQKNKRIDHAYDYVIPQELEIIIKKGMRVVVPFGIGNRRIEGFVTVVKEASDYTGKIKKIKENIDKEAILNEEQIELCLWMKACYCSLFYESLSYFTMGIKTIQEINYFKNQGNFSLDLNENWFMNHYFNTGNEVVSHRKVKQDNQVILDQLLKKKVIDSVKTWKTIFANEEQTHDTYHLTETGRQLLQNDKKLGKKQRMLLEYLNCKDMSGAELKMCSTRFDKSLEPLILKAYVTRTAVLFQGEKGAFSEFNKINGPAVILTDEEKTKYHKYNQLIKKNHGIFFHVFDAVSKYRLFFKAIEDKIKANQSVVVIFPEVNMTFQRMEMFYKYFGEKVGVFHGRLTPKERFELFENVKSGRIQVVIGVGSALFLPFKNLGLIIIDDEHDSSHTTISAPKFHITDIAKKISEIMKIAYILADDMPRIAIWYLIENKVLNKLQIGEPQKRQNKIEIIDMQKEIHSGNMSVLSRQLIKQIKRSLQQKRMSVLFINNKGYANSIFCRNCGHVIKCPNCNVSLKYFINDHALHCHYCGHQEAIPAHCSVCGSDKIRYLGLGIDQLEENIKKIFPNARIKTVQGNLNRSEIKKTNQALLNGEIDIFIGTQVLINHFSFFHVGLTAAILIDQDLNQGDYRASETVYQTYSRFFEKTMGNETVGLIQTNEPENDTIYSIVNEEFQEFYREEIRYRKVMKYPPIVNMIVFGVFQKNEKETENDAFKLYVALKSNFKKAGDWHAIYKPIRLGITKGGNVKYQIVLKILDLSTFQNIMMEIIKLGVIEKLKSKVSIQINP
ncbi:primosomal protein N' [Acetobacterium paludosum]|uniref:Probable replication restart protein PriA n=1 Tax=Acetobacterium paludosum TaxID=52693 RepID=A0A923HUY2_9FIRM|nr:primosomal protein N' [Acetobacterium paludosum]MBC3887637.1 primosomal protein N' [Acetobacterium paludosum]